MAESQNDEIVINEAQLEQIREIVGKANEIFRRTGMLESEKIQMMGVVHQLQQQKQEFMKSLSGEYGLDPEKLEQYQIDLETGKIMENPEAPQQGFRDIPKGANGPK